MKKKLSRGVLIAVEGIDGSGKSTLISSIATTLAALMHPVVTTKEPGATALGSIIRTIVQKKEVSVCPKAEYLLFAADRAQHFVEYIIPLLDEQKALIISDRMADSSLVYQGYARGLGAEVITTVNAWVMQGRVPDLVMYLRLTPEQAQKRLMQRNLDLTSFERDMQFTQKVAEGFELVMAAKNNVIIVDGTKAPEAIAHKASEAIMQWLFQQSILV